MPTARRCSGCGATLNDPVEGATTIACRFCGLTHDLPGSATGTRPVVMEIGPNVRRGGERIAGLIVAAVVLVVAGGLYVAYRAMDTAREAVNRATSGIPPTTPAKARSVAPAELATSTGSGWQVLDVPPTPGGFDAFDPVAALPWALDIARAWASDAALTRIDVARVDTTGVVNLSGESMSGYRFRSPGRQTRWKQEADTGSPSLTRTGLMLRLRGGAVEALLEQGRNDDESAAAGAGQPAAGPGARARQEGPRLPGSAVLQRLPDPPATRRLGLGLLGAVRRFVSASAGSRRTGLPVLTRPTQRGRRSD